MARPNSRLLLWSVPNPSAAVYLVLHYASSTAASSPPPPYLLPVDGETSWMTSVGHQWPNQPPPNSPPLPVYKATSKKARASPSHSTPFPFPCPPHSFSRVRESTKKKLAPMAVHPRARASSGEATPASGSNSPGPPMKAVRWGGSLPHPGSRRRAPAASGRTSPSCVGLCPWRRRCGVGGGQLGHQRGIPCR